MSLMRLCDKMGLSFIFFDADAKMKGITEIVQQFA